MAIFSKPRILVTGATGKTGGAVAAELLRQGIPVRAVVRTLDDRSERLKVLGAETVVADFFDFESWLGILNGIQYAYFLPVMHPFMIQGAAAFAAAARQSGLQHIVQMTQWLSSPCHPSLHTRQLWLVEKMFSELQGIGHTIVNPGMFADNFLRFIDFATLLRFYPNVIGNSRSAPVSNEDIGRVVASILRDPEAHDQKTYRPTGPKLLSASDMAQVISKVIGTKVWTVKIPFWMFKKTARMQGANPFEISSFRHYLEDLRTGAFEFAGGVNSVVEDLTGTAAEDFATTAARYAEMPFAQPTVLNRLRAFWNFNRTPVHPGWNFDTFERHHFFPQPTKPRFAIQDDDWRETHGGASVASTMKLARSAST
jgi:NAD(P)H dehydrogenase (quinone)